MINHFVGIGNLTRDPESKTTTSGIHIVTFNIAINRMRKKDGGEAEVDFIPVKTFGNTADICMRYLAKGKKVCVMGELQTYNYEAQDGTKKSGFSINASSVEFLTPQTNGATPAPASSNAPANGYSQMAMADAGQNYTQTASGNGFIGVDPDESLPF